MQKGVFIHLIILFFGLGAGQLQARDSNTELSDALGANYHAGATFQTDPAESIQNNAFFLAGNGVTVMCPDAAVGDTGVVNEITYTKRDRAGLNALFAANENNPAFATTCTSGIQDLSEMFRDADSFNQPIGHWDVSSVTNMNIVFFNASSFDQPIGNWDVSSVTNMDGIFIGTSSFNQPIANWDVSNVTNMRAVFNGAAAFNYPIDVWDVSSVTEMDFMFFNASSFNRDLRSWCVQLVTSEPQGFAGGNSALTPGNFPIWGTCDNKFFLAENKVTVLCQDAAVGDSGVVNGVTYTKRTREQITVENASTTCTSGITDMFELFAADNPYPKERNVDVKKGSRSVEGSGWDYRKSAFYDDSANPVNSSASKIGTTDFNEDISSWDVSSVTNMGYMFSRASSFNQPIGDWDVSSVTDMRFMFVFASHFNQPIGDWDVSRVRSMDFMFEDAVNFNQNLTGWCVGLIPDEPYTFAIGSNLESQNYPKWGTCADNLIQNGNFTNDLFSWTTFFAEGLSATIDVVDGEAAVTNISGAGGEVWHLQLNQGLTSEIIDALEVGAAYNLRFDARSTGNDRPLRVTFGQDGGNFTILNATDVTLSEDMETYEDVFILSQTFGAMRLAFEMGLSNDDVYIDNVFLIKTKLDPVNVTFQVDISGARERGDFNTGAGDKLYLRGGFNDWGTVNEITDNQGNVWSIELPLDGSEVTEWEYKYYIQSGDGRSLPNDGWEGQVGPGDIGNRVLIMTGEEMVLDVVNFNNIEPVSVENPDAIPAQFSLHQNYPNPFNPTTQIDFELPQSGEVTLAVYDLLGREVARLLNQSMMSAGTHTVTFDAASLSSGIYIYKIEAGGFGTSKMMTLVK